MSTAQPNGWQLDEPEQRLLALARERIPLAEVAVRLGVPIGEADRRITLLCAKLGVHDLAALQSPPIDEDEGPGETPLANDQPPVAPSSPRVSRRAVLTGAGVVGTLAAVGLTGWVLKNRTVKSNTGKPLPTAANTPASTATTVATRGAALITPAPDAFEIRTFAPGELIDWHSGAFFMKTDTGHITGHRARRSGEPQIGDAASAGGGRFVLSNGNDPLGLALDRTTGRSWSWPNEQLAPVALSKTHLVFAERGPSGPTPTGKFFVVSPEMDPISEVSFGNATWSMWLLGDGIAVVVTGDVPEAKTVDLASGHHDVLFSPPPTSADGKQRWQLTLKRESPLVLVATVGYYALDPTNHQPIGGGLPTWLIQRLRWDGTLIDSHWSTGLFVEQECISPDGRFRLREQYLHQVPPMGEGSGEYWPAAVVLDAGGEPVFRIRSAGLQYGDSLPFERWLADSSGFVALFRGEGESTGYDFFRYGIVRQNGSVEFLPTPPLEPDAWGNRHWNAGPVPSPTDWDLLSFGRFYLYNLRTKQWQIPNLADTHGPAHPFSGSPWDAPSGEMLFILGHGGHGGRSAPTLITPLVEPGPFPEKPEMRFQVARTGSCLNVRPAPQGTSTPTVCLADGVQLRLDPEGQAFQGAPADALKYTYSTGTDGDWVMVATPTGHRGWVSASYLDWYES